MWLHRKKGSIEAPSQIEAQELQVQFPISSNPVSSSDGNNIIINDYAENNPAQTVVTFTPASGYLTTPYGYTIFKNGSEFLTASNVQGVQTESWYWDAGDSYTVVVYISQAITFSSVTFFVEGIFNQTTYSQTYNSGTFSSTGNVAFLIRQQIPEMKVIDFVSGLFKMFNLVAYIENGLIVCKTLDSYYAAGNTYDISKYVEVDSSEVNVALPYREVVNTGIKAQNLIYQTYTPN
jgi:hypothetical protein